MKGSLGGKTASTVEVALRVLPFTLDEPTQDSLTVTVQFGADEPYCMSFGPTSGNIVADRGRSSDRAGLFKARDADRPVTCPLP